MRCCWPFFPARRKLISPKHEDVSFTPFIEAAMLYLEAPEEDINLSADTTFFDFTFSVSGLQ